MTADPITIVSYAFKSSIVIGLAGLLSALLHRRAAGLRHLIWLAALLALLFLPLVESVSPSLDVPARAISAIVVPMRIAIEVQASSPWRDWPLGQLAWLAWAAGAGFFALRFFRAQTAAWLLARRAEPWLEREPGLRLSAGTDIPMVCGLFKPVIVLPVDADSWSAERLRLVLAHERMHILRRDTLARFVAQLVCALYWPQPLVWLAAARMRKESEVACDDGVIAAGERASVYAEHLLDIVRGLRRGDTIFKGGIAMGSISNIERRMKALFDQSRDRRAAGWCASAAVAGLAVLLVMTLATWRVPAGTQNAGLAGTVRDASGAAVPQARVTIKATRGDYREVVMTNGAGEYSIFGLPPGSYDISVAKPGFALVETKGIETSESNPARADVLLNIGRIRENLTVRAERVTPVPPPPASPDAPRRIRVGGSVLAAKILSMTQPAYPPECKAEGIEGLVILRAVVGKDGTVINLERVNKLVDARLADAAMQAVQNWRYQPTLLNGEPVEVVTEIEVNFTLTQLEKKALR